MTYDFNKNKTKLKMENPPPQFQRGETCVPAQRRIENKK